MRTLRKSWAILFLFVAISWGCVFPALAENDKILGVDPALIQRTMEGKELVFRRRYDEAIKLFQKIRDDYPDSATGLFGAMAVWQIRMFENDDFRFKSRYEQAEKRYEKLALHQLRKGNVPPWELFVHGAADGMRGFFKARQGKWFKALSHGLHALRMFKQLKWREPHFVDTDLGFGMYKYWRSVFTSQLRSLPFFGDHRKEGITMVENVAAHGRYASDLALANLVFIYGQEDDHYKAVNVADRLLAKYPENVIIKFQKGKNYLWAKKYDEALPIFEEIYKTDPSIIKALFHQGIILFKKKEYGQAKSALEAYIPRETQKDYLAVAYYWLGRIAEIKNNREEAIDLYKKSLSQHKLKATKARLRKLGVRNPLTF